MSAPAAAPLAGSGPLTPATGAESDASSTPGGPLPAPAAPRRARWNRPRTLFWIAASVVAVLIALGALALQGTSLGGSDLDPGSAAQNGSRAVVEVLRQQGVDVRTSDSFDRTTASAADPAQTTVLLYDRDGLLTEQTIRRLGGIADRVVLVDPDAAALTALAPGVRRITGTGPDSASVLTASCELPAAQRAGSITGAVQAYDASAASGATTCFPIGGDALTGGSALVQVGTGPQVTVLGAPLALQNGTVLQEGDAALALNLLGQTSRLVWYIPGPDDVAAPPSIGELTPPWVTPVILLLLLSAVAAGVWRGRRLGPLVVENLPVHVRASETMEGRARLYETANARLRALDSLRIGTTARLAAQLGLSRRTPVHEVADAVAALLHRDPGQVRAVLVDAEPTDDASLVARSDDLLELERATAGALHPGGNTP